MSSPDAVVAGLSALYPWPCEPAVAWAGTDGRIAMVAGEPHGASLQQLLTFVRAAVGVLGTGDVVVSNDPAAGAADVGQLTLVRGMPVGAAMARVRVPDLGGFALGGLTREGYDVWGEGARFPALRLAVGGNPRPQSRMLLTLNSRTPRLIERALDGLLSATARLQAPQQGAPPGSGDDALSRVRGAIGGLRPGAHRAHAAVDLGAGWPHPVVRGCLTVGGGSARLDLSDSDAEVPEPLNCATGASLDTILRGLAGRVPGATPAPASLAAIDIEFGEATVVSPSERARTMLGPIAARAALEEVVASLLDQAGLPPGLRDTAPPLAADAPARLDPERGAVRASRLAAIRDLEREAEVR
jgi:N-methylhydantoinase B/oxoprolinase/acetone carboxylase alpha subunit